jgi:hypothetical protein
VRAEVRRQNTQGAALSAQGTIDRTPGRLVVWALICLYASITLFMLGAFLAIWTKLGIVLMAFAFVPSFFCLPLIISAIVMRVSAPE